MVILHDMRDMGGSMEAVCKYGRPEANRPDALN